MSEYTIEEALRRAAASIGRASPSARQDAEVLLARLLKCSRSELYARGDVEMNVDTLERYQALAARRAGGEPVAYLVGDREFWSLSFKVGSGVMIPRPDTETLVSAALEVTRGRNTLRIADLGTGSGAVAVALAHDRPKWAVLATDIDEDALAVARRNAKLHALDNISFRRGDWCTALENETFDLVVSNPPYIRDSDPHLRSGDLRFEPPRAHAGGADGLDAIREIVAAIPRHVHPGGWVLLEHGYDQGNDVAGLLGDYGFTAVRQWHDLGGHVRVSGAQIGRDA